MTALIDIDPIGLEEMDQRAALMTRVDRKYLVPRDVVQELLDEVGEGARVLEIDGERTFSYASLYYDSKDRDCFADAAGRRRRRYKVRRRDYLSTGTSFLEVKTRGGRGESVKQRVPWEEDSLQDVRDQDDGFVAVTLREAHCELPDTDLEPVLRTRYDRTTLLLPEGSRLTIDADLVWEDPESTHALGLEDLLVVETKAGQSPGVADRFLWSHGPRPVRLSKFATGMALLDPALSHNRWHRTLTSVRADAIPVRPVTMS
jgi:inorganic triphosphatase YgiF